MKCPACQREVNRRIRVPLWLLPFALFIVGCYLAYYKQSVHKGQNNKFPYTLVDVLSSSYIILRKERLCFCCYLLSILLVVCTCAYFVAVFQSLR